MPTPIPPIKHPVKLPVIVKIDPHKINPTLLAQLESRFLEIFGKK
jgi:hypothetical protein